MFFQLYEEVIALEDDVSAGGEVCEDVCDFAEEIALGLWISLLD